MRLVLAGAGHAHAEVLRQFAARKEREVDVVLVSPLVQSPYSGMVPGWMAGHYGWDECCIDFGLLCQRAGAVRRTDAIVALDADRRELLLESGERLSYDWLSLNVGSTLQTPPGDTHALLPMRPLATLKERWDALLDGVRHLEPGASCRIVMVGGGAAGVEAMLSTHSRLTALAPHARFSFALATHGDSILQEMAPNAVRHVQSVLSAKGIQVVTGFSAERLENGAVMATGGRTLDADAVLWATGAQAYRWPGASGLQTDERGFVRVDRNLRSLSHPNVFAVGDCAAFAPPLAKSGVYAVRMGPVLAHNIAALIDRQALNAYRPQKRHLVLIGTGGRHAIAAWGALSAQGAWAWRWKERIDRRFLARYNSA